MHSSWVSLAIPSASKTTVALSLPSPASSLALAKRLSEAFGASEADSSARPPDGAFGASSSSLLAASLAKIGFWAMLKTLEVNQ